MEDDMRKMGQERMVLYDLVAEESDDVDSDLTELRINKTNGHSHGLHILQWDLNMSVDSVRGENTLYLI